MSEDKKNADATEAQAQAPAQENATELTITDLNALKQIIDVASQRGAFKPNEMMTVGSTYNKLETFLSAVAAQQPAPAPDGTKGE
jgi:hypothetical protein|tara:strand:- start:228 stop:482 length:255 start_codon:yes stop_codon:yes gene_type:complete